MKRKTSPKVQRTYNLELAVVEAFDEEVKDQTRSKLIEALMINWLVEHSRENTPSNNSGQVKKGDTDG